MPITPVEPIVVPAKTLDKYWVKRVIIFSDEPNTEAHAEIELLPYNDSGDKSEELKKMISISGVLAKAAANPEGNLAKAMHFILAAIDDEYKALNQG